MTFSSVPNAWRSCAARFVACSALFGRTVASMAIRIAAFLQPLAKRLNGAGYPATLAVENVSAGYHTLAEAFSGWRDSPPHKANMLKNGVTKLGIAASYAPNTKYKVFWTLIMASTEVR